MAPRKKPAAARRRVIAPKAKAKPKQARRSARAKPKQARRSARAKAQLQAPREDISTWRPLQAWNPVIGQQVHLKGTYQGESSECIGQVEGFVSDREGDWVKMKLTGSPHVALQEWRRSSNEDLFTNRHPLLSELDPRLSGIFVSQTFREVDPGVDWRSNLLELRAEGTGLAGLAAVAHDLGYGVSPGGGHPQAPPPANAAEEPGSKPKRLKGKARIKAMVNASMWDWKGSSLDPGFRRPHVGLKRKREKSESSESSGRTASQELSDQEDLFPEEAQSRHIARKCPGLLARHAIKMARKRLLTELGEDMAEQQPIPVFVRYFRQVFDHPGVSAPMKREYLTIAHCLDSLLEGNVLKCLDIGVQRLKAVEQISQGVHPGTANRLELIPADVFALASPEEKRTVAQEQRRELKTTWGLNSWNSGPWAQKGKGWGKPLGEEPGAKIDKGGKSGKGKDKGKPWGKTRHPKGVPAASTEVVRFRLGPLCS